MATTTARTTRRHFLRSTAVTAGAAAALPFAAPAFAQRPRLVYWCYQFLKSSDDARANRSEEHTSELQSRLHLVCRLLLEKKKKKKKKDKSKKKKKKEYKSNKKKYNMYKKKNK